MTPMSAHACTAATSTLEPGGELVLLRPDPGHFGTGVSGDHGSPNPTDEARNGQGTQTAGGDTELRCFTVSFGRFHNTGGKDAMAELKILDERQAGAPGGGGAAREQRGRLLRDQRLRGPARLLERGRRGARTASASTSTSPLPRVDEDDALHDPLQRRRPLRSGARGPRPATKCARTSTCTWSPTWPAPASTPPRRPACTSTRAGGRASQRAAGCAAASAPGRAPPTTPSRSA